MHNYLKLITLTVAFFATTLLPAQITPQRFADNPKVALANLRPYFFEGDQDGSYALKGYKPFYISHFGRHGSRFLSRPKYIDPAWECFSAAKAEGLLTPKGDSLYNAIKMVTEAQNGMYGELAPLGAKEHRAIAKRMYEREKKVFTSGKRSKVRCVSSVFSRCIVSMVNFTEELSSHAPSLELSYLVGQRYNDQYINVHPKYNFKPQAISIIDSLKRVSLSPETLLPLYFTDTQKVAKFISNPYEFEMGIYFAWAVCFDLDFLSLDITNLVPADQLAACGKVENAYRFATVSVSEEFGEHVAPAGECLLRDIVEKADDALKSDSDVAADLRFAHDSGLLPMCQLLGIEGFPTYTIDQAHKSWNMADVVPMCANLQMVFYKGKEDVLVRIMLNEKPAVIPAMTPVNGIYYRWNDIREHILNL